MGGQSDAAERRASTRIDTQEAVVFSDYRAIGPLKNGTVVDRSTGGFRIVTTQPEKIGTTLQIELPLRSEHGTTVVLFEGRVAHVVEQAGGEYAMGIQLSRRGLAEVQRTPARSVASASSTVAMHALASAPPVRTTTSVPQESESPEEQPVSFRRVRRKYRAGSWGALLAILALVFILVLLIIGALNDEKRNQDNRSSGARGALPDVSALAVEASVDDETSNGSRGFVHGDRHDAESAGPLARDDYAAAVVDALDPQAFLATAGLIPVAPGKGSSQGDSAERFASLLDYAGQAADRGERGLAMAVIRRALRDAGKLPTVWRDLGANFLRDLETNSHPATSPRMDDLIPFRPVVDASPAADSVRVEVDATDHVMRVWRGASVVATYPVGLGRNGRTPQGTFHIANKLRDPDWYNEGQVVPAGAPRNPIGDRWLGLGDGNGATSYGIHPTSDAGSIGRDESLGCVRMRPEDARALFRLVPLGAPVRIHD